MLERLKDVLGFILLPYMCMWSGLPEGSGIAAELARFLLINCCLMSLAIQIVLLGLLVLFAGWVI